ncbi:MAG: thiosulfate oxidation carrier complex protein SoxZ [Arcobacteraceae bacterium]|jgi:sulfur-oxidizing protein SoxZ|nr:thiosulfate oxidation carrier complex protein SoxZ [Arcobacteraceae bacterium]
MKLKAKASNGIVEVKSMFKHEMLSYQEAERKKVPANFLTYIVATVGSETVFEMSVSQFVSKDPFIKFTYKGGAGDEIVVKTVDLLGNKEEDKVVVK